MTVHVHEVLVREKVVGVRCGKEMEGRVVTMVVVVIMMMRREITGCCY